MQALSKPNYCRYNHVRDDCGPAASLHLGDLFSKYLFLCLLAQLQREPHGVISNQMSQRACNPVKCSIISFKEKNEKVHGGHQNILNVIFAKQTWCEFILSVSKSNSLDNTSDLSLRLSGLQ